MKWPIPTPPRECACWEFWRSIRVTERGYPLHLIPKGIRVSAGNIELTQKIWDELPDEVQEGFFKLSLLEKGTHLKGVGRKDIIDWLDLDSQLTPKIVAGRPFADWYRLLPRIKRSDDDV
jgi:hypothetical protein